MLNNHEDTNNHWPKTVEEAVSRILSELPEEDKGIVRNTSRCGMCAYHMSLGVWVRNTFGLWKGNEELLRSCGCRRSDDASGVILGALWEALQKEGGKRESCKDVPPAFRAWHSPPT